MTMKYIRKWALWASLTHMDVVSLLIEKRNSRWENSRDCETISCSFLLFVQGFEGGNGSSQLSQTFPHSWVG